MMPELIVVDLADKFFFHGFTFKLINKDQPNQVGAFLFQRLWSVFKFFTKPKSTWTSFLEIRYGLFHPFPSSTPPGDMSPTNGRKAVVRRAIQGVSGVAAVHDERHIDTSNRCNRWFEDARPTSSEVDMLSALEKSTFLFKMSKNDVQMDNI